MAAISIEVFPDKVPEFCRAAQAEVDVVPVLIGAQGEGRIVVRIGEAAILVIGRNAACRWRHCDDKAARRQVIETVDAVAVGDVGGCILEGAVAIDVCADSDGQAGDAALVSILDAIAVDVVPNGVTHRILAGVAEIYIGSVLAGGEAHATDRVGRARAVQVIGLLETQCSKVCRVDPTGGGRVDGDHIIVESG